MKNPGGATPSPRCRRTCMQTTPRGLNLHQLSIFYIRRLRKSFGNERAVRRNKKRQVGKSR